MPADIVHFGDPMLRFFMLASFVLHGAGTLSFDTLLFLKARHLCPSLTGDLRWLEGAPRVVIVGAGFGGIAAAYKLRHAWANVTLIDQRNYHLFQPLLYQVATATLSPADIAVPMRAMLRGQQNCRVLMGQVTGAAPEQREVLVGNTGLPYDYLVLATGARHSYFGKDTWEAFAPGLKKVEDATAMRGGVSCSLRKGRGLRRWRGAAAAIDFRSGRGRPDRRRTCRRNRPDSHGKACARSSAPSIRAPRASFLCNRAR